MALAAVTVCGMKSIVTLAGPRDAGPGEREQMLERALSVLEELGVETHTRIDVPSKGTADEDGVGPLRGAVHAIIPALQSGSLFAGRSGVIVVDAQQLLKAEAEVIAELVAAADPEQIAAVFVAAGAVPAPLGKVLRERGEVEKIGKLRERDASAWLTQAARDRGVRLDAGAMGGLVQRFGSDVAALGRALDQLAVAGEEITADEVIARFRNRPDEPMWYYSDAISDGDQGEALRRLADFLQHGHPLQLLAFLEGELRRRSLAAAAPDIETYAEWVGRDVDSFPVKKAWRSRTRTKASDMRLALRALSKADLQLKTAPEVTHRLTMERLTVALSRWYGGARTRARAG